MVVGSDRVDEFDNLLNKYNGEEGRHGFYGFDNIKVVSAGERDPDAEGVTGMSASKMRAAAQANDFEQFKLGLPKGFRDGAKLFSDVRKFMGINEEYNLTLEELNRDLYIRGEIWNVGDVVKTTDGDEGTIIRKGTNYVVFEDMQRVWLHDLVEEPKKITKTKQAKGDVADVKGTQPAKYYAKDADGDEMSVSTKKARARHFAKGKSGPAPGDADADTKPSKHTKKFKQMYGETENPCWDTHKQVGMKKKNGKMVPNCVPKEEVVIEAEMKCPPATQDVAMNTKNRNSTIKNHMYGPLNVDEPGDYWEKIADKWDTTVNAAKKSLCGNCVAFDISPRMEDCMPGPVSDDDGRLGYCWMHHFKCHSARTCDTWAKGGPIKDDKISYEWQDRANMNERKLTDGEKDKLKDYEKEISKKDFIDRYGKEEGESIYYATLTKMAKQHAEEVIAERKRATRQDKNLPNLRIATGKSAVFAKDRQDAQSKRDALRKGTPLAAQSDVEQIDEKIAALVKKAEKSGMPYGILKKVYDRGMAAYKTGHRPGATPQQWALARVNSFTTKSKGTWGKADADLAAKVRGSSKKEAVNAAQQAAIAISKKKSGKYDEDGKRLNEEFELFAEKVDLQAGVNDPGIFKAVFLAGGPGSGKSFIVGKTALTTLGLVLINSDDAFERQLAKIGLDTTPEDIFSPAGQAVRGKAKALTKLKQKLAVRGRLGLVIDGTGKDFEKIKKQSEELKRIGYETAMIFVNTDLDTALARNKARKRTLPDADVTKMWKAVQNNIGKFQRYYGDKMVVVDNSDSADYEANVLSAYRKMSAFTKTAPKLPVAKKWIAQQKKERGIKK